MKHLLQLAAALAATALWNVTGAYKTLPPRDDLDELISRYLPKDPT